MYAVHMIINIRQDSEKLKLISICQAGLSDFWKKGAKMWEVRVCVYLCVSHHLNEDLKLSTVSKKKPTG